MKRWRSEVLHDLDNNAYTSIVNYYEKLLDSENVYPDDYWHLGIAYLLSGEEEAAQATWLLKMSEGDEHDIIPWTQELAEVLESEAHRQEKHGNIENAWLIREYLKEISANSLPNLFKLLQHRITLDHFSTQDFDDLEILSKLDAASMEEIEQPVVFETLKLVLELQSTECLPLLEACLPWIQNSHQTEEIVEIFKIIAVNAAYQHYQFEFATDLVKLLLVINPNHFGLLGFLPRFCMRAKRYTEAIEHAKVFCQHCQTAGNKMVGQSILLQALMNAGAWKDIDLASATFMSMLEELYQQEPLDLDLSVIQFLIVSTGNLAYVKDDIKLNRRFYNNSSSLFLKNIHANIPRESFPSPNPQRIANKRLKIGYLAHTLRNHSVGWLSRWLFKYHNREEFDISIYLVNQTKNHPFFQDWFYPHADNIVECGDDLTLAANQICDDQIDILVDLDSLTLDTSCSILALKPAPIQVSWLGWDASGLPSIDYYIADPHVLPKEAQEHYTEKIWHLPETYIAVDGFESDAPSLRRSELGIPQDAVVFFSSQSGFKRHPHIIRQQLKILRQVPDSFFLLKGWSDEATVMNFINEIAIEEDVEPNRLLFLPMSKTEYVHRANLQIADVVLDTYPYNGATTTLETLWMGVPLVTRVGTQFAARNSYAFLKNLGIDEGIAYTDEQYVDWGIQFGKNENLRKEVSWKLRQAKQTSPLWDTKKFTQHMETAYTEMWERFIT